MRIIVLCGNSGCGKDTIADILKAYGGYSTMALADELKRLVIHCFSKDVQASACFGPSHMRQHSFVLTEQKLSDAAAAFQRYRLDYSRFCAVPSGDIAHRFSQIFKSMINKEVSVRWVLQQVGTEWGRRLSPTLWVDILKRNMDSVLYRGHDYSQEVGLLYPAYVVTHSSSRRIVVTDARFVNEVVILRDFPAETYWVDASQRLGESTDSHASEPKSDVRALFAPEQVIDNNGKFPELEQRVKALLG